MGTLGKIVILVLLVAALGYYLDSKGVIDIDTEFHITPGNGGSQAVWTNSNASVMASDPGSHRGDQVELDVYVFNEFNLSLSPSENATAFDAYLGNKTQLEEDPYNTSRRVVLVFNGDQPALEECIHITGSVAGSATVTTSSGAELQLAYITVESYEPATCNT